MGGMEVSVRDIEPKHDPKAARGTLYSGRLRITPKGILQLAKDGHFLPLSRSKISDKSKADVLQKFLVMVQILWMATQCIARKVYGLPLALLEVHTMIHVLCAVVLLIFWVDVSLTPFLAPLLDFKFCIKIKTRTETKRRRGS